MLLDHVNEFYRLVSTVTAQGAEPLPLPHFLAALSVPQDKGTCTVSTGPPITSVPLGVPQVSHGAFGSRLLHFYQRSEASDQDTCRRGNMIPKSASEILKRTLDTVRVRANANGDCFGGEIEDAMRDAGVALGVDRLEVLLTRTLLLRTMESLGETYPAQSLEDFETRIPVSRVVTYLHEAIVRTANAEDSEGAATSVSSESQ